MTEIKANDIIQLTYANDEIAYVLVDEITENELHAREPPDKSFVLNIVDGFIEGVKTVELVYSAPVTGVAVANNFVPGQSIVLVYKEFPEEEKVGVITQLEEDMIDVNVDGEMIYIDFGYVKIPDEFHSITLHGGFVFEMEDEYFIPESQHRFTLERQLADFMDKLLSTTVQTSRTIRQANQIVQRFRELRQLFSTNTLEPRKQLDVYTIEPHQVKWILPMLDPLTRGRMRRILYPTKDDSMTALRNMSLVQQGKNAATGPSDKSITKKLLNMIQPYVSDYNGTTIQDTVTVLLNKPPMIKRPAGVKGNDVQWVVHTGTRMAQVLVKPYADPHDLVTTQAELATFVSYHLLPVDYTRAFVPGNTLLSRVHYQQLAPYTHMMPSKSVDKLEACIPSPDALLQDTTAFYSIHGGIQQLSPYLLYQNNVSLDLYVRLRNALQGHLRSYHKIKLPEYVPNPLVDQDDQSASEYQVSLLYKDNGSLYAIQQCKQMKLDYTVHLDTHIEKHLDDKQVAPPVTKIYATLKQLTADNKPDLVIFYDPSLDKTNYSAYDGLEMSQLIEQLVRMENLSPKDAYVLAPHYQQHRRPVVDGEYAQLATANGALYYKRINGEWKMDDTCSGPYPCTSNEPQCTTDCVDVSFRLKQNLVHSILFDYQLGLYKNKATYDAFVQAREKQLTYETQAKQRIMHARAFKYNHRLNAMGKSVAKIDQSPKTPLLYLILEKPIEDRYTELTRFIRTYTRVADGAEDVNWLYCVTTGLKLLPRVFQDVIKGYDEQQYEAVLETLKTDGLLQVDDGNMVTTHGGFSVASSQFEHVFEDTVRSSEFVEEVLFKLKREDDPLTPFVVELLNAISVHIHVSVTSYYNFMIHKILSVQAPLLIQSIGLVLKLAEIEYNIAVGDKLQQLFSKQQRLFQPIFVRFKQSFEPFEEKDIERELKTVASYYEVKLLQLKTKKMAGVEKTNSTVWDSFLPPFKVHVSTTPSPHNSALMILHQINEFISHKPKLREGSFRQNTVLSPFVPDEAYTIMKQWVYTLPSYHGSKPFIPVLHEFAHEGDAIQKKLSKKPTPVTPIVPDTRIFDLLIPPLMDSLTKSGFPVDFVSLQPMPLAYLQSFIRNIGRLFPSFLLKKPTQYKGDAIPIPFEDVISPGHAEQLKQMANKTIFASLVAFSSDGMGLADLLADPSIQDMLLQFQLPMESDRHKYEFYIYTIFQKYITRCPEEHLDIVLDLLRTYRDMFIQDRNVIFIGMEAVRTHMLTSKALESNKRRLALNKLSAEDRFVFNFRQMANLDKNARIGRSREYNQEQHDMETDLFNTGGEDNDQGEDGNGPDDDGE